MTAQDDARGTPIERPRRVGAGGEPRDRLRADRHAGSRIGQHDIEVAADSQPTHVLHVHRYACGAPLSHRRGRRHAAHGEVSRQWRLDDDRYCHAVIRRIVIGQLLRREQGVADESRPGRIPVNCARDTGADGKARDRLSAHRRTAVPVGQHHVEVGRDVESPDVL